VCRDSRRGQLTQIYPHYYVLGEHVVGGSVRSTSAVGVS
jgi:hypothetical protein